MQLYCYLQQTTFRYLMLVIIVSFGYELNCSSTYDSFKALYKNMNGQNWKKGKNWLKSTKYCGYEGVTCDANEKVIELDLSGFGITEPFSNEIACFTDLKSLLVSENNIQKFPKQICDVYQSSLQFLDIQNAGVIDEIPSCICGMPYLQYVYAGNNELFGDIPVCISESTVIREFKAPCNNLSGWMGSVDHGKQLTDYDVGCNFEVQCFEMDGVNVTCGMSNCNSCELVCPSIKELSVCGNYVFIPSSQSKTGNK